MQRLFTLKVIFEEYVRLDREYPFPEAPFTRCTNPKCSKLVKYRKHGFYKRYFVCSFYDKKIVVRRYICPICGHTISFMPNICLPRYIHALEDIFQYIFKAFHRKGTLKACLEELNIELGLNMSRQLLYQYRKRFLENLTFLQSGIRQMVSEIELPSLEMPVNEKAKIVLTIVKDWPGPVNLFSQRFLEKNRKTILTNYNLL